ncbi:MAG: hypothetical protein K1Y36_03150 [Blastocatellia bacterium]|nr:hypothetical protein [Blastocatellia bacterium]
MSRVMLRWTLCIGLWAGLAGYSSLVSISAQAPQAVSGKEYSSATIRHDCAPWDGAAVTVVLSGKPQKCEAMPYPNLTFRIWKSASEASGQTFKFPDDHVGGVSLMKQPRSFVQIKSGWVRFQTVTEGSPVKGDYDLTFEDGVTLRGAFQADWCKQVMPCG